VIAYTGPATFIQNDREVQVNCRIETHQETIEVGRGESLPGLQSWDGSWWSPEPRYTLEAGSATLQLFDGSKGDILLNIRQRNGDEEGTFQGSGETPV
jgi:hypothetical protein